MEFDELYKNYLPNLKSYLYRLVANTEDMEDLAQETFIRAYKNIDSFEGRSSFKTWIFTIAINLAKDHYNAKTLIYLHGDATITIVGIASFYF